MESESEEQGADWSDLRDCSVQLEKENPQEIISCVWSCKTQY
jgi:hypothetical protein